MHLSNIGHSKRQKSNGKVEYVNEGHGNKGLVCVQDVVLSGVHIHRKYHQRHLATQQGNYEGQVY